MRVENGALGGTAKGGMVTTSGLPQVVAAIQSTTTKTSLPPSWWQAGTVGLHL